jgi:large subunit ribosomal protein L41
MSKYVSKSMKKNLPLTTKRAGKGFYKGKGCTSEGHINSKARFITNPLKRLELVVPDLSGFRLKPYIASSASRFPPEERHNPVAA